MSPTQYVIVGVPHGFKKPIPFVLVSADEDLRIAVRFQAVGEYSEKDGWCYRIVTPFEVPRGAFSIFEERADGDYSGAALLMIQERPIPPQ